MIAESYYEKLRRLSFEGEESSKEFDDTVDKLKECVHVETNAYHSLSMEEMQEAIKIFEKKGVNCSIDARIYAKLQEYIRDRARSNISVEISNIISSKIIIDVLKKVTNQLIDLDPEAVEEEEIDTLLKYNDVYKYTYLTRNKYIEKLAISGRFSILALPDIKFEDVENHYNMHFVKECAHLAFSYIQDSLNELINNNSEDKYTKVYISVFEIARIEVMLPYLDKDNLIKLSEYVDELDFKKDDSNYDRIKRLIRKRKEEFE